MSACFEQLNAAFYVLDSVCSELWEWLGQVVIVSSHGYLKAIGLDVKLTLTNLIYPQPAEW